MSRYYTLVGSRNTPPEILSVLTELAHYLAMDKFIGRSGGTRTAVELALSRNVPVYNLHNKESLSTITSYIERHKDGI